MELRQLRYFQTVSRLQNITKAAEELHVAQPSISIAIQKLEEELGVRLLERGQRKLSLTAEGEAFLKRTCDILERVEESAREMEDYRLAHKGFLRVGITPIIGSMVFPEIFSQFIQKHPYVHIDFMEAGTLGIRDQLLRNEIDLGIIITSNMPLELDALPVLQSEMVLCVDHKHVLADKKCVDFIELAPYPFILFQEDMYSRQIILEESRRLGMAVDIVFSSQQISTIVGLVETGLGISFLPAVIAKKYASITSILLTKSLPIQAGVAWKQNRYMSNAAKIFVDFVQTLYKNDKE